MVAYRAYILKADGHFKGVVELDCATDAEALAAVRGVKAEHGVELWLGRRKVVRLETSGRTHAA